MLSALLTIALLHWNTRLLTRLSAALVGVFGARMLVATFQESTGRSA